MDPETLLPSGAAHAPQEPLHQAERNQEWRRFFRMHPKLRAQMTTILTSVVTSLLTVAVVLALGWSERDRVAAFLATTMPFSQQQTIIQQPPVQQPTGPKELSVTEVVAKVNASVVSIEVSKEVQTTSLKQLIPGFFVPQKTGETERKIVGRGSGFFVSSDGLVVTNRHVIDTEGATYTVITAQGTRYEATLVDKDPVFDLAVLRVAGARFPAATLGNSDALALGQSVVAIGFALGQFENSISVGVVSGLSRSITAGDGSSTEQLDRVIQTDAAINPGNSGGPLINLKGEVIGVNVAVAEGSQSVGFALPSNSVKQVVDSVKAYGSIVRPYLGISYAQITAPLQGNTSIDYGIAINTIVPNSPASGAGLRSGDVILSIDGVKLDGDPSFSTLIRTKRVGQTITLVILRNGTQSTIKTTLAQAPRS